MEFSVRFMLAELVASTLLFVLGRLAQLLLNSKKPPYKAVNVDDPSLISVYIFRIRKYNSGYIEYRFRNENGRWKRVINKKMIIGITIAVLVLSGIIVFLVGIKDFLLMAFPIALYVVVLSVTQYFEAYRVLTKN